MGLKCADAVPDRAALRRQRIVDAARLLFITNGFHATGVAQIARESGVAVGQLYRDFEGKEDIVAAIVEGDCAAFLERQTLRRAISQCDADSVWHWLCHIVEPGHVSDSAVLFAEIIAESVRNPRIAAIFARAQVDIDADLLAALALLAPGEALTERRQELADFILTQSIGLKQQRLLRPATNFAPVARMIVRVIAAEIAGWRGAGAPPLVLAVGDRCGLCSEVEHRP